MDVGIAVTGGVKVGINAEALCASGVGDGFNTIVGIDVGITVAVGGDVVAESCS